jgi:plasmid stability protein
MPTLTVGNVSSQLYESLARRASEARRSVSEEAKQILADALGVPAEPADKHRRPELITSEEISPPCDLPRSDNWQRVSCKDGGQRLPDPLTSGESGGE